ncbi:phosphate-starvation-inducible PsiE family protein [Kiritimatiellaeota bacterium B1221]|nr:phosphate-starvation-inducible PsiE family protein [Kiritimatiellaeota bacterium B1221]
MNSNPKLQPCLKVIRTFETVIIIFLVVLMMVVVGLSALELAVMLWNQVRKPPYLLLNLPELLEVLGFFMMVLIGLELLETIKNYLTQHALHVEVVILVAMIAISRKVIILDMKEMTPDSIKGIAFLLLSLAVSYFLIKKGMSISPSGEVPSHHSK